jgi:hypothetical protein
MKQALVAAAIVAILTLPAAAQRPGSQGNHKTPLELQYERERAEQDANERAYNEQMKRMKSQQGPAEKRDPWSGVRPANETNAKR